MGFFSRKPKEPKPLTLKRVLVASPSIHSVTVATLDGDLFRFEPGGKPTINLSFTLGWRDDFTYKKQGDYYAEMHIMRAGGLLGVQFCGENTDAIIAEVAGSLAKGDPEAAIRQMSSLMDYVRDFHTN